jgi:putative transposase
LQGIGDLPNNTHGAILTFYLTQEGKKGGLLFNDAGDRLTLIDLFKQAAFKHKKTILAYTILYNQYDILLQTSQPNLSHFLHHINSGYANYYNRHHQRQERVFGKHSKHFLFEEKILVEASFYIHLLPNIQKETKSLLRFRWSSLSGYIEKAKQESWIDYSSILNVFKKEKFAHNDYKSELICRLRSRKKPFWSPQIAGIAPEDNKKLKSISIPAQKDSNLAAKIKRTVIKDKHIPPLAARNAAIFFIKKYTDLNNEEISRLFAPLKKSSISQMSRRHRNYYETEPSLRKAADRLEIEIKELLRR